MKAQVVIGALSVETECVLDGQMVIETPCRDFEHFRNLPGVVSYKGKECKKTGWSSDTNRACYKQSQMIARKVG